MRVLSVVVIGDGCDDVARWPNDSVERINLTTTAAAAVASQHALAYHHNTGAVDGGKWETDAVQQVSACTSRRRHRGEAPRGSRSSWSQSRS